MTRIAASAALAVAVFFFVGAVRADIYVSDADELAPRYANRALDDSFRLLVRDPIPVSPVATRASALHSRVHAAMLKRRHAIDPVINRIALQHAVDASLIRAVVEVESRFNTRAVSPRGAVGPMQLMPGTARQYGVTDRFSTVRNLEAGAAYLRDLLNQFGGNTALALAAYNAGPGAVVRHRNAVPPYRETMLYVPQVLAAYARYRDEVEEPAR
ncbi:MAG: lytic transglycosylase domain-containing protein [Burkholderiales bacterium]